MSNPMTSSEIEDVLSSIRRLVAQEPPARSHGAVARRPDAANVADGPDASGSMGEELERLILTAALRVVPGLPTDCAEADGTDASGSAKRADSLEKRADTWSYAHGKPVSVPLNPPALAPEDLAQPDRASLERTIAELEAVVSTYDEEWEPDEGDAGDPPLSVAVKRQRKDAPETAEHEPAPDSATQSAEHVAGENRGELLPSPPVLSPPVSLADNVRPFLRNGEVPRAPAPPTGGTNGIKANGHAETDNSDVPEAPNLAEGASAADADVSEAEGSVLEPTIDEAHLRALIAQVLREELAGELGARITRNVRKFVRAEIARALAERDFL